MSSTKIVFIMNNVPQVDHMTPIIYKLQEENSISSHIILNSEELLQDHRVKYIKNYEKVSIYVKETKGNATLNNISSKIKEFGRDLPTDMPNKLYSIFTTGGEMELTIPSEVSEGYDNLIVAMCWSVAGRTDNVTTPGNQEISTLVLPHGDSPYMNPIVHEGQFQDLLNTDEVFIDRTDLFAIGYKFYRDLLNHDYIVFPNHLTAKRLLPFTDDQRFEILGSSRYNEEWVKVIQDLREPPDELPDYSRNIVLFSQKPKLPLHKEEVIKALQMLGQFPDTGVIIKQHPRSSLLDSSDIEDIDHVQIVSDDISSGDLIEWGDLFVSLGTSITFEPVIRNKPVCCLEFAHANDSTVAHYFENSDIRSKDDLYDVIFDISVDEKAVFYHSKEKKKFVDEILGGQNTLSNYINYVELIRDDMQS